MAGTTDMNIPLGQGEAIRQVHRGTQQTLGQRRLAAARKRKDKKKKKKRPPDKFAGSKESGNQPADSGQASKQGKDSKSRGTMLHVIV